MNKRGIITVLVFILLIFFAIFFILDERKKAETISKQDLVYDYTDERSFCTSIGRTNSYLIFSVIDETGKRLENVNFEIYERHHIMIGNSYTNYDGKSGFSGMEDETYYIRIVDTPDGYENHNVEYVIKPNGEYNCFKKNIKLKKEEKRRIDEYVREDIAPFKRLIKSTSNTDDGNYIVRYNTFLDDIFEGMQIKVKFGKVIEDENKEYPLRREVFLEIDNAQILSYTITPSGDREDYAKIIDLEDNICSDFDGSKHFYVATKSYITEGNLDFTIKFSKYNKKFEVKMTQTYSLIRSGDYGRFIVNTLNEEQSQVQGENGVYKLYNENGEEMNFIEYSGKGATINYRAIKPAWYRVDRIINNKVIDSQNFLVENNFITNIWM